jgi:hypothetical protein
MHRRITGRVLAFLILFAGLGGAGIWAVSLFGPTPVRSDSAGPIQVQSQPWIAGQAAELTLTLDAAWAGQTVWLTVLAPGPAQQQEKRRLLSGMESLECSLLGSLHKNRK